jgi:hypothetical protein
MSPDKPEPTQNGIVRRRSINKNDWTLNLSYPMKDQ